MTSPKNNQYIEWFLKCAWIQRRHLPKQILQCTAPFYKTRIIKWVSILPLIYLKLASLLQQTTKVKRLTQSTATTHQNGVTPTRFIFSR